MCLHTLIHVSIFYPAENFPNLHVKKTESLGDSNVTVCLEWSVAAEIIIDRVSHNVTISPQVDVLSITDTSACFIAPYGITHNVSIISNSCRTYTVSDELEVYYGKLHRVYVPHNNVMLSQYHIWLH